MPDLPALRDAWAQAWPDALRAWSRFTRLRVPIWCLSDEDAAREGLTDSFAMIRFVDQAVVVNLALAAQLGVGEFALQILAHEVGHHILAPANLDDHARCLARMRWALPTVERHAAMLANMYTDLLINDRLKRSAGISQVPVFERLGNRSRSRLWTLYMRVYEILWSVPRGTLAVRDVVGDVLEGDAQIAGRLLRAYAGDWVDGSGRFAALCLPYLLDDAESAKTLAAWHDTRNAAVGGLPSGLVDIESGEREGAIHPSQDPELSGLDAPEAPKPAPAEAPTARGQTREPFQYGEILKAAGISLTQHDAAVSYYRERALPHLIPYPARVSPESTEPLPEGLERWAMGDPLDQVAWFESLLASPTAIPGMTLYQRVFGTSQGAAPERQPLHLDLYVDSSGSMPNPQVNTSYLTLAGAIIALSALRAGARVQATLWSGKNQFTRTEGFVRDETAILRILTGYYGGATAFPIHLLRETYEARRPTDPAVHVLVISDDGVVTMFDNDERGNAGWEVVRAALGRARGGGTLALNLPAQWESRGSALYGPAAASLARARDELGWRVQRVASWEDLVQFAREFSRITYGGDAPGGDGER